MTERQVLDARTPQQWEQWLERNHDKATEIWLRLLNKNAPEPGMSYGEAVDVALCFGWIDSLARGYDDVSRIQRFSPRKPRSAWSKSNVERVQRLIDAGRMRQAGQHMIDAARPDGRWPNVEVSVIHHIHHDERWWPDPEAFDPTRFIGDAAKDRPRSAYLPFDGGRRICIGQSFAVMEIVLMVAIMSQRLTFDLCPNHPVELKARLTLRPMHGLRVIAHRREARSKCPITTPSSSAPDFPALAPPSSSISRA